MRPAGLNRMGLAGRKAGPVRLGWGQPSATSGAQWGLARTPMNAQSAAMPDMPAKVASAKSSSAESVLAEPSADASNAAREGAAKARTRPKGAKPKPTAKSGGKKRSAAGMEPAAEASVAGPSPKPKPKPGRSAKRKPPRQTFLVAATFVAGDGPPRLRVYAAVVRGAAEALAAVRAELGPEVPVELTGKLSNRMAKALGLKPDEVRPV